MIMKNKMLFIIIKFKLNEWLTVNDDDYTNDNDTIRSVASRNFTEGRYHSIISWKVNSVEKMAWLICAGVDGIITDEVN